MPPKIPFQHAPAAPFVAYLRVSTDRQGASGLGLEAQHRAIATEVTRRGGHLLADYTEIESGRVDERPQLHEALAHCRRADATLIVAKVDRLARSARFLLTIVEGTGKGGVVFCDLPDIGSGPQAKFVLTMMAGVAELERGLIAERVKAALAAAKVRGTRLGNPRWSESLPNAAAASAAARRAAALAQARTYHAELVLARRAGAHTLAALAQHMTGRGIAPPGGEGACWHPSTVARILRRLDDAGEW